MRIMSEIKGLHEKDMGAVASRQRIVKILVQVLLPRTEAGDEACNAIVKRHIKILLCWIELKTRTIISQAVFCRSRSGKAIYPRWRV